MKVTKALVAFLSIFTLIFFIINVVFRNPILSPFHIFTLIEKTFYNIGYIKFVALYLSLYIFPLVLGLIFASDIEYKKILSYIWITVGINIFLKITLLIFVFKNLSLYIKAPIFVPEVLGLIIGSTILSFLLRASEKIQYAALSISLVIFGLLNTLVLSRY